jgi:hypothetical protein
MVTQKDLQDVVKALNEVLMHVDKRITALEELAKKPASQRNVKKVEEKA